MRQGSLDWQVGVCRTTMYAIGGYPVTSAVNSSPIRCALMPTDTAHVQGCDMLTSADRDRQAATVLGQSAVINSGIASMQI